MAQHEQNEIRWQSSPNESDAHSKYRIIRTPASGALSVRVLSHRFVGARTHYYGGRTVPCSAKDCRACNENQSSRWHGWVIAQDTKTLEQIILEFPPAVGSSLEVAWTRLRTLRGLRMKLFRVGGKANGKVIVNFGGIDEEKENLPSVPELEPILCRLWGINVAPIRKSNRMADHVITNGELSEALHEGNGHID